MLGQALASVYVGLECLLRAVPDVFIDTTGAAFTYPIAKLLCGCTVVAYVHYPMISTVCLVQIAYRADIC